MCPDRQRCPRSGAGASLRSDRNNSAQEPVAWRLDFEVGHATTTLWALSSLITAIEAGHGIALAIPAFKHVSGKRLLYRPLVGTTEVFSVGIARAKNGDVTPAGEKFCEILRKVSKRAIGAHAKAAKI